jgi:hypothetical protein
MVFIDLDFYKSYLSGVPINCNVGLFSILATIGISYREDKDSTHGRGSATDTTGILHQRGKSVGPVHE